MIIANQSGISAILLFGSRAREDSGRGSDTDLLLIAPPGTPRHKSIGHLSMFFYSWEKLLQDARDGDLFVCHIVNEAMPVFDPLGQLDQLRSAFRLRRNYSREIAQARDLGWLLDRHAAAFAPSVVVRRMIWCVRTILIAQRAELGAPAFAPATLADGASESTRELLLNRHQRRLDVSMRQRFRHFMIEEGGLPPLSMETTIEDYHELFIKTGNTVGLQTIESGTRSLFYKNYL